MDISNIKTVPQLSPWVTYELEGAPFDPPVVKFRLRPLEAIDLMDSSKERPGRALAESARSAIAEWDFTDGDKPVLVTDETKTRYLTSGFLSLVVKGGSYLAVHIVLDARNKDTFLKN